MNVSEMMGRIRGLLTERGISQASFSRQIEVSPQTFSAWMAGRNRPGIEEIARTCEVLNVSPSWLITGRNDDPNHQSLVGPDSIMIPRLDLYASCNPNEHQNEYNAAMIELISVNRQWVSRYCGEVNQKALRVYGIDGDSMSPTLEDGDSVIIDTSVNRIYADSVFAFDWDGCTYIKRVQRIGRLLKIISDNTHYEPWTLNPEEERGFRVIGRVVTKCLVRKA